uniref:Uncharacterized protein n=1 Tax=Rhizophora mucronata TaxID=61149 RepID=A0A2P2P1I9_RHIMU
MQDLIQRHAVANSSHSFKARFSLILMYTPLNGNNVIRSWIFVNLALCVFTCPNSLFEP